MSLCLQLGRGEVAEDWQAQNLLARMLERHFVQKTQPCAHADMQSQWVVHSAAHAGTPAPHLSTHTCAQPPSAGRTGTPRAKAQQEPRKQGSALLEQSPGNTIW